MYKKLEKRIERLEKKFDEIYTVVKEIKISLDDLVGLVPSKKMVPIRARETSQLPRVISTPMSGTYEKGANPWALRSAQRLFSYEAGKEIIDGAFETYKPTIRALQSSSEGLTAGEISKITGRARNTEVLYLKKLQRAGFTKSQRKGRKALYKLVNAENLPVVFGGR
jgi:DNA-binding transcriptional ArsR family regulator